MLNTQDSIQRSSVHHDFRQADTVSTLNRARSQSVVELGLVARGTGTVADSVLKTGVTDSFDTVTQAICRDAQTNTKEYLLRSNTGHDGE